MGLAETADLLAKLSMTGNFQKVMRSSIKQVDTLDSKLDRTQNRANVAGQQIGTGVKNVTRIAAVGVTTLAALGVASLKVAGDFEAQLNTINTVARVGEDELKTIGQQIRKLARDTGTTTEDLTQGYYDLVSAGVAAKDATVVLTAANTLAIGGLATTAETVDLLTTAINTYKMDAQDAASISDIFAKAIERGKVTAAELAGSFATVGPIAAASKIGIDELGAAYARLTASGVPAAEAATQTRSAIVALTKVGKPLEKLQKETGRNYLKLAGKKGLVFALETMRKDAAKSGVPLIDLVGRVEALNFILATTGPNFESYNEDLAAMGDASNTAAEQMAERQKGLNHQLAILKANAKDAGITIGSALLPKITPLVKRFNEFVAGKAPDIERFADQFAGLFTDENISAGAGILEDLFNAAKQAAPAIAASAEITGKVISTAVAMFNTLPKELQALAISGLAINKLTGGLVTNIAGGLIGSVLKQFRAGLVNVSGGVVNVAGGVGGAAGGAAGAAGAGGKMGMVGKVAGAAIGTVTIVGSALAVLETQQQQSALNTQYSSEIKTNLQTMLSQSPKREDLLSSLGAVEQGIKDITANPLHMLVAGDALENLRSMRESLLKQLAGEGKVVDVKAQQAAFKTRDQVTRTAAQTKAAIDRSKERIAQAQAETRRETTRGAVQTSAAARQAGRGVEAAVRASRDIVNVTVNVSANSVQTKNTTTRRYGNPSSREKDDGRPY